MTNSNASQKQCDTETVEARRVACNGGGGANGHPKVYMDMGQSDQVDCKYCGKKFVLKS